MNRTSLTQEQRASQLGAARVASPLGWGHTLPEGARLDEFEIIGLIGEGGFGIVYLAFDHSLERRVALKEYMPSSLAARVNGAPTVAVKSPQQAETFGMGLKSFINEARLLAQFDHPALVKVHRFWEANGTAYMVMPLYEGPTLKRALAESDTRPDEAWLRRLLDPLLDALAVLHRAHCFHRDIAPDNILLTPGGPLLLDFGAARRVISDASQALTVMLKEGYAPVEQYGVSPTMRQGPWTDIYALSCVMRFAITGQVPPAAVERLICDRMEPLSVLARGRYGEAFLATIDAGLSIKPEDRPQDVAQFRALLDRDREAAAPVTLLREPGSLRPPEQMELRTQLRMPQPVIPEPPAVSPHEERRDETPAVESPISAPRPADTGPRTLPRTVTPRDNRVPLWLAGAAAALVAVLATGWWLVSGRASSTSAAQPPATSPASDTARREEALPTPVAPTPAEPTPAAPSRAEPRASAPAALATALPANPPASPPSAAKPSDSSANAGGAKPAARTARQRTPDREGAAAAEHPGQGQPQSSRCGDLLQKASLDSLTAEEAAYLKAHCQ